MKNVDLRGCLNRNSRVVISMFLTVLLMIFAVIAKNVSVNATTVPVCAGECSFFVELMDGVMIASAFPAVTLKICRVLRKTLLW